MSDEARFARVEGDVAEHGRRIGRMDREVAAIPFMREDIAEIRGDMKAVRQLVEQHERDRREEEHEKEKLSSGQKVAVIGAVAVVVASLITALATLAQAGAFG